MRIALSCVMHRWLDRNTFSLYQCLELVLPQWKSSQGQTPQPAPLPLFLHHHCLFHKPSVIFAWRDRELYLETTLCCYCNISSGSIKAQFEISFYDFVCRYNMAHVDMFFKWNMMEFKILKPWTGREHQLSDLLVCYFICCRLTWLEEF